MQNNYIYLLFYLVFIIITINCKTYTKDEVLSFSIIKCKNDKDCPENSTGCEDSFCQYKFFCKNNDCIAKNDPIIYSNLNNTNNNNDNIPEGKLTVDICKVNDNNNDDSCSTHVCKNNSQCYSNNCNNGTCISNDSNIISYCSLNYENDKITCGKVENEKCKNNNECYFNNCDNGYCSEVISDKPVAAASYGFFGLLLLIGVFFVVLCIFLIIHIVKTNKNKN